VESARGLTAEASSSLWAKYEAGHNANCEDLGGYRLWITLGKSILHNWGSVFRFKLWSNIYCRTLLWGNFKWTGFFFGMGMAHQWPAVRLGGVAPAIDRSVSVNFSLASVPNATQFQIILTKPSGAQIVQACPTSPCIITGDARQGAHLMRWQYLDGSARVLAQERSDYNCRPYPDTRSAIRPLDSLDGRKVPGIDRDKHSHRAFIQSPADPPDRGFRDTLGPMPR